MAGALHFILALFLAATTVVFFAKAMRLGVVLAPVVQLARRVGKANALLCVFLVALMAHVAVTKDGTNTLGGVAWTSTHNPTNATDHLPGKTVSLQTFSTPRCRVATNVTYRVGWTHDELLMHIRNLVMLATGNDEEDGIDHCMGFKWESDGEIDLKGLLADCCAEIADRLVFRANGEVCVDGKLRHPKGEPDGLYPAIYNVSIHGGNDGEARIKILLSILAWADV